MRNIQIQKSNSNEQETISIEKNMVIVGANGSGKTRFGSKLEQINNPTKRISAQRYLQLSELVQRQDFETADTQLKNSYKNQSPIQPQNDYQQVLMSLFAEESRRNEKAVDDINAKGSLKKEELPESAKEQVIKVWNFVFPYRTLKLEKDRVRAVNDVNEFSGTEMSDGEKVGLYLISQILLAEKDCILIVDEPELHLHKALMVRLWNKLEKCRSDCTFIYITHDLDFAVSKPSSRLVWIQGYKNNLWEWKEIDPNEVIPENLFLEILGSRKPILFVEGDRGSLDIQIYQTYYDNFTVIPCGSCEKVIEAVKGLKAHSDLHDKKVYGLIDRDFRTKEQLNSLKNDGVFSISLNEIENIFLIPEIIEMVCEYLSKVDKKEEIISEIKNIYATNKEGLAFATSKYRMNRYLGEKFGLIKGKNDYDNFKISIFSELDQMLTIELPDNDVEVTEILKVYPHKGLVNHVQAKIELSKNGYKNLVLSFLSSDKRQAVMDILKIHFPEVTE
ncbi:MAG: ABC transporter, ATP-binding protein-related protein [candidate division CPR1 bacterium GW2011_GWA2_42_17]|uniref:ABC transporter, ATP-binding protein-related protein n=1 Tax=candidate division CPR1 bacterium GW2011_GWA2_42_17 TaxID=1618341 RepID=A0A0G0Z5Q6_9BACT|nr:MAG: ABC transporter, ATP-binding protein-related protein [candidate division CPR1 bacterium GW2011_GWA2_42_17]